MFASELTFAGPLHHLLFDRFFNLFGGAVVGVSDDLLGLGKSADLLFCGT